jgi:hypothetical protein
MQSKRERRERELYLDEDLAAQGDGEVVHVNIAILRLVPALQLHVPVCSKTPPSAFLINCCPLSP